MNELQKYMEWEKGWMSVLLQDRIELYLKTFPGRAGRFLTELYMSTQEVKEVIKAASNLMAAIRKHFPHPSTPVYASWQHVRDAYQALESVVHRVAPSSGPVDPDRGAE